MRSARGICNDLHGSGQHFCAESLIVIIYAQQQIRAKDYENKN